MTSDEFARRARKRPLVIVPFGSTEGHGSHLPLCTDAFQAEEVARRVALEFDALVCPPVRYGECLSTRNFPGTLSLSFDTIRGLAYEVVSELARNGIDKVLLLSGHAGRSHMTALRQGALKAIERCPSMRIMLLSDYDIAYDLRGQEFPEDDGHAGEIETSRMLGIRPELVGESRPRGKNGPPEFMVLPDPDTYFPSGVLGDSGGASAKKGKRIDDYVSDRLCDLVARNFGLERVGS
ncbi:MAG: creatininase family protein [Thermoplasmata archaeon]